MTTAKINLVGKTPGEQEYAQLTSAIFSQNRITDVERRKSITLIIILCGLGVLFMVIGLLGLFGGGKTGYFPAGIFF